MNKEELENKIFQDGYNAGVANAERKKNKPNVFDLLGFLPEEVADFKRFASRTENMAENIGIKEALQTIGHGSNKGERENFVLGICLGPRVTELMSDREMHLWQRRMR
jgi:hypothetical protein